MTTIAKGGEVGTARSGQGSTWSNTTTALSIAEGHPIVVGGTVPVGSTILISVAVGGTTAPSSVAVADDAPSGRGGSANSYAVLKSIASTAATAAHQVSMCVVRCVVTRELQAGDHIELTSLPSVKYRVAAAEWFTGILFASPIDVDKEFSNGDTASTAPDTGATASATTDAGDLIYGCIGATWASSATPKTFTPGDMGHAGSGAATADTSEFAEDTAVGADRRVSVFPFHKLPAATTTVKANGTLSPTGWYSGIVIALKPGVTYSRTATDDGLTSGATDAVARVLAAVRAVSDNGLTASATEQIAKVAAHPRALADNGLTPGATDTVTRVGAHPRALADAGLTASATEQIARVAAHPRALADTGLVQSPADSIARVNSKNRTLSDVGIGAPAGTWDSGTWDSGTWDSGTGVLDDSLSAVASHPRALADNGLTPGAADSLARVFLGLRGVTDNGLTPSAADAVARAVVAARALADNGLNPAAVDVLARVYRAARALADTGLAQSPADALARAVVVRRSLADNGLTVGAGDSLAMVRSLVRSIEDTGLVFAESLSAVPGVARFVFDDGLTPGAGESLSATVAHVRTLNDNGIAAFLDELSAHVTHYVTIADNGLELSDAIAVVLDLVRDIADDGLTPNVEDALRRRIRLALVGTAKISDAPIGVLTGSTPNLP